MVLNKREKYLGIGVATAVALLLLDSLVVSPWLASWDAAQDADAAATLAIQNGRDMIERQQHLTATWQQILQRGLPASDSAAESQTLHAVADWSQAAGVALISLKSERTTQEPPFQVIGVGVSASGTMSAVTKFIWALETSPIPLRINELKLNSRKDGTDDLLLTISLSTLCMPQTQDKPAKPGATPVADARGGTR